MENSNRPVCRQCGREMRRHTVRAEEPQASKAGPPGREFGGILEDFHASPVCGTAEAHDERELA
jgi:hypothetical protein